MFPSGEMRGVETLVDLWAQWFEIFESVIQKPTASWSCFLTGG